MAGKISFSMDVGRSCRDGDGLQAEHGDTASRRSPRSPAQPYLDALQDAGAEDVEAGIDLVGHKDAGLLHEAADAAAVGLAHHHAVLGRLLHAGDHDGALAAVLPVEAGQRREGELADHVAVEDKEGLPALGQQVPRQRQRSRCPAVSVTAGPGTAQPRAGCCLRPSRRPRRHHSSRPPAVTQPLSMLPLLIPSSPVPAGLPGHGLSPSRRPHRPSPPSCPSALPSTGRQQPSVPTTCAHPGIPGASSPPSAPLRPSRCPPLPVPSGSFSWDREMRMPSCGQRGQGGAGRRGGAGRGRGVPLPAAPARAWRPPAPRTCSSRPAPRG